MTQPSPESEKTRTKPSFRLGEPSERRWSSSRFLAGHYQIPFGWLTYFKGFFGDLRVAGFWPLAIWLLGFVVDVSPYMFETRLLSMFFDNPLGLLMVLVHLSSPKASLQLPIFISETLYIVTLEFTWAFLNRLCCVEYGIVSMVWIHESITRLPRKEIRLWTVLAVNQSRELPTSKIPLALLLAKTTWVVLYQMAFKMSVCDRLCMPTGSWRNLLATTCYNSPNQVTMPMIPQVNRQQHIDHTYC